MNEASLDEKKVSLGKKAGRRSRSHSLALNTGAGLKSTLERNKGSYTTYREAKGKPRAWGKSKLQTRGTWEKKKNKKTKNITIEQPFGGGIRKRRESATQGSIRVGREHES